MTFARLDSYAKLTPLFQKIAPLFSWVIIAIVAGCVLYWGPPLLVSADAKGHDLTFAALADKSRSTLIQAIGGLALLSGLYFTARNVFAVEQTRWTKTFSDAIDQLATVDEHGKPLMHVRIGAITSLNRLSRDSPTDIPSIYSVLLQYVQQRSVRESEGTDLSDCEFALAVLGELSWKIPTNRYVRSLLSDVSLPNMMLMGLKSAKFHFQNALLSGARFGSSKLGDVTVDKGEMESCSFASCELGLLQLTDCVGEGLSLSDALVRKIDLNVCVFQNSDFTHAILRNCELSDCDFTGSDFSHTNLRGATISNCILKNVLFYGADLGGADLRTAQGITVDAFQTAKRLPSRSMWPTFIAG